MKILLSLLSAILLLQQATVAQTYYKGGPISSSAGANMIANQYPLDANNTAAKVQLLYLPGDFNTLPISGNITKIYFRSATASQSATYTDLKVSFIQNAATAMPATGIYYTGLTQALNASTLTLTTTATASTTTPYWVGITLATPFAYNNTQPLIVEVQYAAHTGAMPTTLEAGTVNRRIVTNSAVAATATGAASGTVQLSFNDFGMDIASSTPPACVGAPTAPLNNAAICAGTQTLSWPGIAGATGYDVYLDAGTGTPATIVSANQAGTTYNATVAAGPYVWKIVPKNTAGSATGCATFNFTVNPVVVPNVTVAASPGTSICAGTAITFTATPTNGGSAPSYQWKKGTTNVGTNSSIYTDNGLTNGNVITVVLTSNAACAMPATVTSAPVTVTVLPRPTATATAGGPTTFCQGSNVSLQAGPATGFTYQWQNNGADIAGATLPAYSATASGDYRVLVSNGACTDTSSPITVMVNALPAAAITPAGPLSFCEGGTQRLNAASGIGYTYQWQKGGVDITGATGSFYDATFGGSYTVIVTNGCSATSAPVVLTVNPAPVVTITPGGSTSFCQGGNVQLCASSSTPGLTYYWTLNNLTIFGATSSCYTASASGSYCVIATNPATGCTSKTCQTVTVSTQPSAVITTVGTTTFCQGSFVTLRAAQVAGYTYQWYRNGVSIAGATIYQYSPTTAGAYHVVIVNGACTTTTTDINITVNPLPVATATAAGPLAFCQGGSVTFAANTGAGLTYQWRRNGAAITGETGITYTATQSGLYSVLVSNGTCTGTSNSINVVVSTPPVATVTAQGPLSFCQNSGVTLEAAIVGGYTYQWQKDGVNIPGATAAQYYANTSGSYAAVVTNGSCVATSPAIAVSVTPGPPVAVTPSGPLSFCQGGMVTLTTNRGVNYSYTWLLNGIRLPADTNASITSAISGIYTVIVNDGNCTTASAAFTVNVNPFPVAVVTVTGGNVLGTSAFSSYQWYRNGVIIDNATGQTYAATRDGYYSVVVSDALGCTATSAVQRITSLSIGNPSGNDRHVRIYPNPATSYLIIDAGSSLVDAAITTMDGRVLSVTANAGRIDVEALAQGMYLVRITDHATGNLLSVERFSRMSR